MTKPEEEEVDHTVKLEEAAKRANKNVQEMCSKMLDEMGGGPEYICGTSSAASTLLYHAIKVYMGTGKKDAASIMWAIIDDTAAHLKKSDGIELRIKVEEVSKKDSK